MKPFARMILALSLALAAGCDMAIDNSIALFWDSFWQGPKVGGMLFGAILIVSLFAIRTFKVYRARVSNGNKFKKVSDKYKGRRLKHNPNGTDKCAHVDANTMSLGVRKPLLSHRRDRILSLICPYGIITDASSSMGNLALFAQNHPPPFLANIRYAGIT